MWAKHRSLNTQNMAQVSTQLKVLVISARLAGPSLAQGLVQASISFQIFGRDTSAAFRAQGYRIRISPDGAEALQRLLPDHLWKAFEATCSDVVHGGNRIDAPSAEALKWDRPQGLPKLSQSTQGPIGQNGQRIPDKAYNVDQAVLRSVLLFEMEEHISFGKRLQKFETSSADGTSEQGSFLVGADGVRSVARQQLLPGMTVLDTKGRAVFGKTPVEGELFDHIPQQIGQGICLIGDSAQSRIKFFCDVMKFDRTRTQGHEHELGLHIPADYVYWVLVFRNDVMSPEVGHGLLSMSNEQSAEKALDLTATWNSKIRCILTTRP